MEDALIGHVLEEVEVFGAVDAVLILLQLQHSDFYALGSSIPPTLPQSIVDCRCPSILSLHLLLMVNFRLIHLRAVDLHVGEIEALRLGEEFSKT